MNRTAYEMTRRRVEECDYLVSRMCDPKGRSCVLGHLVRAYGEAHPGEVVYDVQAEMLSVDGKLVSAANVPLKILEWAGMSRDESLDIQMLNDVSGTGRRKDLGRLRERQKRAVLSALETLRSRA